MIIKDCMIPDVKLLEPRVFGDERGYFFESYSQEKFDSSIRKINFVQDNESRSVFGALRGLHYQLPPFAQSKLVRVIVGKVLDIVVDIRKGSETFGCYVAVELSEENKRQLFIPKGFAHGFITLSEAAVFLYKVDNKYAPDFERTLIYNDPSLDIDWKVEEENFLVSEKDKQGKLLSVLELFDVRQSLYA